MVLVEGERVEVLDLSADAAAPVPARGRRPIPRFLTVLVAVSLAAGGAGTLDLRAENSRRLRADAALTVTVVDARGPLPGQRATSGETEAAVTLTLRVSVPVRVIDAELDGAPPVSRPGRGLPATRDPSVTVRWRVLCAEVGTIPGPRLLDVDLRAASVDEHRRVRLATTDEDAVSRVFRLAAEQGCSPAGP